MLSSLCCRPLPQGPGACVAVLCLVCVEARACVAPSPLICPSSSAPPPAYCPASSHSPSAPLRWRACRPTASTASLATRARATSCCCGRARRTARRRRTASSRGCLRRAARAWEWHGGGRASGGEGRNTHPPFALPRVTPAPLTLQHRPRTANCHSPLRAPGLFHARALHQRPRVSFGGGGGGGAARGRSGAGVRGGRAAACLCLSPSCPFTPFLPRCRSAPRAAALTLPTATFNTAPKTTR